MGRIRDAVTALKPFPAPDPARLAELQAARQALANDPVNAGRLGTVDEDSPAGRANLAAQDRVREAEKHLWDGA